MIRNYNRKSLIQPGACPALDASIDVLEDVGRWFAKRGIAYEPIGLRRTGRPIVFVNYVSGLDGRGARKIGISLNGRSERWELSLTGVSVHWTIALEEPRRIPEPAFDPRILDAFGIKRGTESPAPNRRTTLLSILWPFGKKASHV